MKLSRYFADLTSSYNAELDDLRTDSEGKNVLKARLAKKRGQVSQLLMMMKSAPEMVSVAFHGGFSFNNVMAMESLVTRETSQLPSWSTLQKSLRIEPWAQALADMVLTNPDGDTFLVTTAGLEYLNGLSGKHSHSYAEEESDDALDDESKDQDTGNDNNNDAQLNSDERLSDEDETMEYDLDKAGANWLAEQGFDRKESP